MANSYFSSSNLSPSPLVSNSVETLDESSLPIAHVDHSLALSSPDQDRLDDQDFLAMEASISPRKSDGSSSSYLVETLFANSAVSLENEVECKDIQVMPEPQVPPLNQPESYNSLQFANTLQTPEDISDQLWDLSSPCHVDNQQSSLTPNVTPGCGSDDDSEIECSKPLFRFQDELLKIEEPTGVGAGLWNLGNTCFINSVLQCFTHTVPLIQSLRSYQYQVPCNCNMQFCVKKALRMHIELALMRSRDTVYPYCFLNNLNYFSPDFELNQQEDAHEFLQAFLDKLERCYVGRTSYRGYTSSQNANIVEKIFGGRLVSLLRCCNCNSVSETFESSLGLSLEIEDVDDLWSALESFTSVEKLDEQLTCDHCEQKVSKEKQLLLDKLPLVTTFHLKRFKNNGFFMEKNSKDVKIPLELDLQPYMGSQENEVPTKYHLYALVEHLGNSLAYGHYSSYVRSAPKRWHKFDDMEVTRIDEDSVLSKDSYILFYAREGTPWFSSYFGVMQPLDEASLLDSYPNSVLDPTNGECISDVSYENVDRSNKSCDSGGVSNSNVKREENSVALSNELNEDVFLSESSEEDSTTAEFLDPHETSDFENPCSEKKPGSCLAIERATTGDELVPLLMDQTLVSSLEQQEGTFQIRPEHLEKNQEEALEQPLSISNVAGSNETEFAHRDMMKKFEPGDRELDQAISKTCSPAKKTKLV